MREREDAQAAEEPAQAAPEKEPHKRRRRGRGRGQDDAGENRSDAPRERAGKNRPSDEGRPAGEAAPDTPRERTGKGRSADESRPAEGAAPDAPRERAGKGRPSDEGRSADEVAPDASRERAGKGRPLDEGCPAGEAAPDAPRERAGEEPSVGRRPPRRRHRPGRAASCARRRRGSRKSAGGGRKVCSGARGAGLAKGVLCKRTEPGAGRFGAAWRGRKLTSARPARNLFAVRAERLGKKRAAFGRRGAGMLRRKKPLVSAAERWKSRSNIRQNRLDEKIRGGFRLRGGASAKLARIYGKTALRKNRRRFSLIWPNAGKGQRPIECHTHLGFRLRAELRRNLLE